MKRFLILTVTLLAFASPLSAYADNPAASPKRTPTEKSGKKKQKPANPQTSDRVGNKQSQRADRVGNQQSKRADRVGNEQVQVADRVGNGDGDITLSGQSGFGGGAFVCGPVDKEHPQFYEEYIRLKGHEPTDPRGWAKSAELVDLWEAKDRGEPVIYSTDSVSAQITRAVAKLDPIDSAFANKVRKVLKYIGTHKNFLDTTKTELAIPPDLQNSRQKPGCPALGMLQFNEETGLIDIDPRYFNALLTNTDTAGSYTHEAVYKVLRDNNQHQDSKKARRLNACLYEKDCLKLAPIVLPQNIPVYQCTSPILDFYTYQLPHQPDDPKVSTRWKYILTRIGKTHFESLTEAESLVTFRSEYEKRAEPSLAISGVLSKYRYNYGYIWLSYPRSSTPDVPNVQIKSLWREEINFSTQNNQTGQMDDSLLMPMDCKLINPTIAPK